MISDDVFYRNLMTITKFQFVESLFLCLDEYFSF